MEKICPETQMTCNNTACTDLTCKIQEYQKMLNGPASWPEAPPSPTVNPANIFPNYGWICPKCGRGNAPHTHTCPCIPIPFTFTY